MRLALPVLALTCCGVWGGPVMQAQPEGCPPPVSHISIEEGSLSPVPGVTFHLRHFKATLVSLGKWEPACYSRMTTVAHAEIFVSNASLTDVFAKKLDSSTSKIRDFKVENGEGKVTLSGRVTKLVPVQFSIQGPVTTDGRTIDLDARTIKADGIPVKALLDLLGEQLGTVLGVKGLKGITVEGNKLSFSPEEIAHLKGFITGVETTAQGLTLRYGRKPAAAHFSTVTPN